MDRTDAPPLDPTAAITAGWRQLSRTPREAVLLTAGLTATMVVVCIPSFAASFLPILNVWSLAVQLLIVPAFSVGFALYALRSLRGESPNFETVLAGFSRWWPVTGAYLLQVAIVYAALVPVGMVAFGAGLWPALAHPDAISPEVAMHLVLVMLAFLPALVAIAWFSIRLAMVWFVAMEPGVGGPLDIIKRSWAMTRGCGWRMSAFFGLTSLVSMAGFLACGVGVFVAIPIVLYAWAHVYDQLTRQAAVSAGARS